jgi:TPP-dependent pyruvate/acetoin dehydrogenase alpha subunit
MATLESPQMTAETSSEGVSSEALKVMFTTMTRIRVFEERLADIVEKGDIKTPCHLYIGQEAVATGVCAALERNDYVWGGHRSHGHYLAKGGDMRAMIAEIYGKVTGCSRGRGGSMHLFASDVGILGTVPLVSATIPLAVGSALASKLRKDGRVSVSFFGDGAVEEGHFHESVNLAALYQLPVVFVCENNFYASHLSLLQRRLRDNIDKAGEMHGVPAERLDGNDLHAVYRAATKAVERARAGLGPTLLECRTYRWRGHVGASYDMDVGVKRKDELEYWLPLDPIKRVRVILKNQMDEAALDRIEAETRAEVEDALTFASQSSYPNPNELDQHVFFDGGGRR